MFSFGKASLKINKNCDYPYLQKTSAAFYLRAALV